ncbi:MAG: tetratricopeptide repeat protein [Verrucomicrobia bacterium]|nr:tetratricopeptide repeat protein [Verrucomicrobiota bacterium]MBU1909967.1 tetratricopeptide repeat protein [Verrucomicrobiota bacterium]
MKRAGRMTCLVVVGMVAVAGVTPAQDQSDNPYYVDGLLVDQFKQMEAEPAPAPLGGSGTMSLRNVPPASSSARPSVAPPPTAPGVAMPPAGKALEHLRISEMFIQKKQWGPALEEIQKGLALDPANGLLLRRGAAIAALAKNYTASDDYYRRLLMLNPDGLAFLDGRASVQIRLRQFVSAQALTERALTLQPRDLLARFNRLFLKAVRGDSVDQEKWDDLLTSDLIQVANWLDADRDAYLELMPAEKFALVCDTVLGEGLSGKIPDILAVLRRANQARRLQQWDKLLTILEEARQMGLQAMGLEMDQAQAIMEQGNQPQALTTMQSLSERFPDHPQVLYNYAYILIEEGSYAEALQLLDKAFAAMPNQPQIAFARVCMLAEAGRMDEAWGLLTDLIQRFPAETRTWLQEEDPYLQKIKADPRYPELFTTRAPKRR